MALWCRNYDCTRVRFFKENHIERNVIHQKVKVMDSFAVTGSVLNKMYNEVVDLAVLGYLQMNSIQSVLRKHKSHHLKMILVQDLNENDRRK